MWFQTPYSFATYTIDKFLRVFFHISKVAKQLLVLHIRTSTEVATRRRRVTYSFSGLLWKQPVFISFKASWLQLKDNKFCPWLELACHECCSSVLSLLCWRCFGGTQTNVWNVFLLFSMLWLKFQYSVFCTYY